MLFKAFAVLNKQLNKELSHVEAERSQNRGMSFTFRLIILGLISRHEIILLLKLIYYKSYLQWCTTLTVCRYLSIILQQKKSLNELVVDYMTVFYIVQIYTDACPQKRGAFFPDLEQHPLKTSVHIPDHVQCKLQRPSQISATRKYYYCKENIISLDNKTTVKKIKKSPHLYCLEKPVFWIWTLLPPPIFP